MLLGRDSIGARPARPAGSVRETKPAREAKPWSLYRLILNAFSNIVEHSRIETTSVWKILVPGCLVLAPACLVLAPAQGRLPGFSFG